MRTELKLYSATTYYNIDLFDNAPIQLEKSIVDIQEPDQRTADFTRTITIPGTHNNNTIFSNIFEVNNSVISGGFNPNTKVNCILFRDGIPQMRGLLQLTNIKIEDEQNVTYDVVIIGRNANLFQDLGDKMLTELDLSAYDHEWTGTNIDASWSAAIGVGYVYPLIDRGYETNEQFYYYKETFPATYVKSLVDAIFKDAGYRFSSTFFSSTIFKSLIMPYTGDGFRMTESEVDDRLFEVAFNSASSFITMTTTGLQTKILFPNIIKNSVPPSIASNQWTVPTGYLGNYIFRAELDMTIKYIGASTYTNDVVIFDISFIRNRGGAITAISTDQFTIDWTGSITSNSTFNFKYNGQSPLSYLEDGDIIYVDFEATTFKNLATPADIQIRFNAGSSFFNSSDGVYNFGASIQLANSLPKQLKQAEFLKGLIKMFNLYFQPDPTDDKKLIIEPRDDFYTSNVIDLTQKIDVSKDYNIEPMGALQWKSLEFHYQKDNDEYNKKYLEQYENEYGFKRVTVSNDFLTQVKKIELPFAPTPLADASNNNRVISKIRFFNADNVRQATAAKPRILYYGGLVSTISGTYLLGDITPTIRSTFAYAGHLDNVANPTFDLSFGMPESIYYGSGTRPLLTNNNLYNKYWKKSIEEITDKDSKILTCSVHLSNVDLQNISFRDSYLIDRQYYRLYKITTDLNSDEPAKCEFLKLKVAPVFVPTQANNNGGIGTIGGDEQLPTLQYYNNGEFVMKQSQFVAIVNDSTEGILNNTTQFCVITADVYLPTPASGYNFETNKSIEITIYNNDTVSRNVYDSTNAEVFSIGSKIGNKFLTDGVEWFKI
jgi:hypothetical protein